MFRRARKIRKAVYLFGLALLLGVMAIPAAAQETPPKAEAFLGYSYVRANPDASGVSSFNLHGGIGSLTYNVTDSLGLVADFGGYRVGNINGVDVDGNVFTYLFGPRFTYRRSNRVTPFVQVLFGGARGSAQVAGTPGSQNAFAMTAGGGLDVKVNRYAAVRLIQAEYLLTRFDEPNDGVCILIVPPPAGCIATRSQNNVRLSTGIVFRFGSR